MKACVNKNSSQNKCWDLKASRTRKPVLSLLILLPSADDLITAPLHHVILFNLCLLLSIITSYIAKYFTLRLFMCVCNIDCSHISFNPVCASDGRSYDNPCQVKEVSCQRQERIEVKFLGHCQGDMITGNKPVDGHYARADLPEEKPEESEVARGIYTPCPENYKNYCVHGVCEYPDMLSTPSCSCHSGFRGPKCDTKEYNVLYVVPGSGKVRYVLIASIIGALQVAIICVVVLCITRKCPRTNRINRQKQNVTHYNSENTLRASTRLI
ncbi:tomoregulin-2a isoform X1 [Tachysurus ichikawai]